MAVTSTTASEARPTVDQQRRMYELMTLMKLTDDRLAKGIGSGEFLAIYWPHRGQEAIAAALGVVLAAERSPGDDVPRPARPHRQGRPGRGDPGRAPRQGDAPGKGKGGTLHLSYPEVGSMLSTGIVGAGDPGWCGPRPRPPSSRVSTASPRCTFGDGATNTGSFHESLNMAAVLDVPVVFVCQNNLYGEKTPVEETMKVATVAERSAAYGMPGVRVDGNDLDALFGVLSEAVDRARSGGGPSLVECVTFRFRGHSFGDNMKLHTAGAAGRRDRARPGAALPSAASR